MLIQEKRHITPDGLHAIHSATNGYTYNMVSRYENEELLSLEREGASVKVRKRILNRSITELLSHDPPICIGGPDAGLLEGSDDELTGPFEAQGVFFT